MIRTFNFLPIQSLIFPRHQCPFIHNQATIAVARGLARNCLYFRALCVCVCVCVLQCVYAYAYIDTYMYIYSACVCEGARGRVRENVCACASEGVWLTVCKVRHGGVEGERSQKTTAPFFRPSLISRPKGCACWAGL